MNNYVLNGAMRFDQNQEGGIYYSDPASETYTLDQWRFCGGTAGVGRFTVQRVPIDYNGFDYCLQAASTTQQTALSATDNMHIEYPIEGSRIKSWGFGTSLAKDITLSFYCVSTQAGDYPFAVMNGVNTRSYVTSFNIAAASTWEYVTITIPGDVAGTWSGAECTFGAKLLWSLGVGSTFSTSTTETWQAGAYWNKTGSVQLIEYIANTSLYITGVQLEIGDTATPYHHRDLEEELLDLQRYYFKTFPKGTPVGYGKGVAGSLNYIAQNAGVNGHGVQVFQPVKMCSNAAPVTFYNPSNSSGAWYNQSSNTQSGTASAISQNENGFFAYNPQVSADGKGALLNVHAVVNSRLGGS